MIDEQTRKIAVLTQPLGKNYGGILQAYALQVVLKELGHQVWTVDRQHPPENPEHYKRLKLMVKRMIFKVIFFKPVVVRTWPTKKESDQIYRNNLIFIDQYIRRTERIDKPEDMTLLKKYLFDTYIVGSDQVWRPRYSPYIPHYFLDFVNTDASVKKLAFSASFGVDELEYTSEQLAVCAPLAKRFDAISVREDSAIKLCHEHFGVNAVQTFDPTLLLEKEYYEALVHNDNIPKSKGSLMSYVLDVKPEKMEIIEQVTRISGLTEFSVFPRKVFKKVGKKGLQDCVYPPLTAWLRGFMDADYIVTDSFHGTVFSIIFNKPFIAIGNASRGISRFTSLLDFFGLGERLVLTDTVLSPDVINKPIDWEKVNGLKAAKKEEAMNFLRNSLK